MSDEGSVVVLPIPGVGRPSHDCPRLRRGRGTKVVEGTSRRFLFCSFTGGASPTNRTRLFGRNRGPRRPQGKESPRRGSDNIEEGPGGGSRGPKEKEKRDMAGVDGEIGLLRRRGDKKW